MKIVRDVTHESKLRYLFSDSLTSAPQPPQNLSVSNVGETTADLDWDDLATSFDDYKVYVRNVTDDEIEQEITGIGLSEADVMGLETGDDYEFWVVSVRDGIESEESNHVTASPVDVTPPDPPTNVSLLEEADGFVRVGADPSPSSDVVGYNAYQDDGGGAVKDNGALLSESEIADYQFDNVTNGTTYDFWFTAEDGAGNESTASTKITAAPSANQVSLIFDGANDNVDFGEPSEFSASSIGDSMSVILSFKLAVGALDGVRQWLFGHGSDGANDNFQFRIDQDNTIFVYLDTADGNTTYQTGITPVEDQWHTLSLSYDGPAGIANIFYDGSKIASPSVWGGNLTSAVGSPWTLGYRVGTGWPFDGKQDEVQLWNKALTDTEISTYENEILNGDEAGLLGYWNCEDQATDLTDLTSNNNHGTINGATYSQDARVF